jgi:UDP-glucuronate 4-epimerase
MDIRGQRTVANILVTGAAGFIGSTLVDSLLKEGSNHVIGLDCFTDYYDPALKRANLAEVDTERFTLVEDDIISADLKGLVEEVEVIYHLAGQPGVRKSWGTEFTTYVDRNIVATQMLLEASRHAKSLNRFVYASSSSVYGDAERYPSHEFDRPAPVSPYGVSKLAGEHLVSLYARNFGIPGASMRFFTVYGPRQRPDMAFRRFIVDAINQTPITVFGDGSQIREFTHVDDIVHALELAQRGVIEPGTVINLSGGSSVSVNEVIAILDGLLDNPITVNRVEKVAGDVHRTGGSTEAARVILGWFPEIAIDIGLKTEIEWIRNSHTFS